MRVVGRTTPAGRSFIFLTPSYSRPAGRNSTRASWCSSWQLVLTELVLELANREGGCRLRPASKSPGARLLLEPLLLQGARERAPRECASEYMRGRSRAAPDRSACSLGQSSWRKHAKHPSTAEGRRKHPCSQVGHAGAEEGVGARAHLNASNSNSNSRRLFSEPLSRDGRPRPRLFIVVVRAASCELFCPTTPTTTPGRYFF